MADVAEKVVERIMWEETPGPTSIERHGDAGERYLKSLVQ